MERGDIPRMANGEPPKEGPVSGPSEADLDASAQRAKEALERAFGGPAEPPPGEALTGEGPPVVEPPEQPPPGVAASEIEAPGGAVEQAAEQIVEAAVAQTGQPRPEKGTLARMATALKNRLSGVRVLGQPLTEFVVGMAVGGGVRKVAQLGLAAVGGPLAAPLAGAAAGGATAGVKEYLRTRGAYEQFVKNLGEDLGAANIQEVRKGDLAKKYQELKNQLGQEKDRKKREAISDQIRYLGVYLKRGKWVETIGEKKRVGGKEVLDEFLKSFKEKPEDEVQRIRREIEKAKLVDKKRLGLAVTRGAVFGAAGGYVGGILVDWIHTGQFEPLSGLRLPISHEAAVPVEGPGAAPPGAPPPSGTEGVSTPPAEPGAAAPPAEGLAPGVPAAEAAAAAQAKQELVEKLAQNPDYLIQKAAEVGKVLSPIQDEVLQKALEQSHLSSSDVDAAAFEKARLAIQHALERETNTFFDNNLQANPEAGLNSIVEAGQKSFESWLATPDAHAQLAEEAQKAITEQTQLTDALTQKVSGALEATPNLFADQAIQHGTTVGQLLQEASYQMTWTGADAQVLGAHIAANYDMLTDMWHNMAANHLIPESPFPVGLPEINDLVAKAQAGDKEALAKLVQALHWIPAGQKFRILNQVGVSQVLALLG